MYTYHVTTTSFNQLSQLSLVLTVYTVKDYTSLHQCSYLSRANLGWTLRMWALLSHKYIFLSLGVDPGGQAPGGVGMPMGNTGGNMGMGHGAGGMGMGPGSSQFPGNMNMNMMGGAHPQASGGYNHMMPGSGMGHPGQVRNSEYINRCVCDF